LEVVNNIYTVLKRHLYLGSIWLNLSFLLMHDSLKKGISEKCKENKRKEHFYLVEARAVKTVGRESENKKEIKIHEHFKQN